MIFWKDKNGRIYWKSEIDDGYLLNIAKALTRGCGDLDFLINADIDGIFEECYNRGLLKAEEAHKMSKQAAQAINSRNERENALLIAQARYEDHVWGSD